MISSKWSKSELQKIDAAFNSIDKKLKGDFLKSAVKFTAAKILPEYKARVAFKTGNMSKRVKLRVKKRRGNTGVTASIGFGKGAAYRNAVEFGLKTDRKGRKGKTITRYAKSKIKLNRNGQKRLGKSIGKLNRFYKTNKTRFSIMFENDLYSALKNANVY